MQVFVDKNYIFRWFNGLDFLYHSHFFQKVWYNGLRERTEEGEPMSEHREEINRLAEEFESCQKILLALGDENRQHLMLEMMRMEHCGGTRVGAITEKTNLSRPAVSHHIQILKEAGILKMRREGTKNYYYFDANFEAMNRLIQMLEHARSIMERLPDRSGIK